MDIDYSVIIRTTGKAHEKYQRLLNSIAKLEPKPKEIIVVLPEGYDLPKERLGNEIFYFSPKGMVVQRMDGIKKCTTKYALICDDDVSFEVDFVQKLYRPIAEGKGKLSVGPLYSFLPAKGKMAILCSMMANAAPTLFHKDRYVSVLRSSGYSYNRHLNGNERRYYETQSAAWTCFFGEIEAIKKIDFEDEMWLDSHGYSALDDQTMFYKAWLRKIKTITVADAKYEHLDGKTSVRNNRKPVLFSTGYNRVVFWHRFIYSQQAGVVAKIWTFVCFIYFLTWQFVFDIFGLIRQRFTGNDFRIKYRGYIEGWKYVRSMEYRRLPSVI